jgi:DNA-binding transcriptional ArsR family regulator
MDQPNGLSLNYADLRKSVAVLRALNHKLRQVILELLDEHGDLTVTEIFIKLRMEQSVVSQHLGMLRRVGIVNAKRDGKYIYYSLNSERMKQITDLVSQLSAIPQEEEQN